MDNIAFRRRVEEAKRAMRRTPIHSLSDLWALNPAEIEEGYRDGLEGFPCSDNRTRAYFHGWRNAQIDRRRVEPDWRSGLLAKECVAYGPLKVAEDHPAKYEWLKSMGIADD